MQRPYGPFMFRALIPWESTPKTIDHMVIVPGMHHEDNQDTDRKTSPELSAKQPASVTARGAVIPVGPGPLMELSWSSAAAQLQPDEMGEVGREWSADGEVNPGEQLHIATVGGDTRASGAKSIQRGLKRIHFRYKNSFPVHKPLVLLYIYI
ncbi:hypothetical protein BDV11DRAFT_186993 [Aspergillus similis]